MDCLPGHIKHDPESRKVAVRTTFQPTNEKLANMLWLTASPSTGVKYVGDDAVAGWDDLYVPEPVEEPQA